MTTVFVSYRHDGNSFLTGWLRERLEAEFGRGNVFLDVAAIAPGENFETRIHSELEKSDAIVVVIGENWQPSLLKDPADFVRREVTLAHELGLQLIPVLTADTTMPKKTDLPPELHFLTSIQAARLRSAPDFGADCDKIIKEIKKHPKPKIRPDVLRPVAAGLLAIALVAGSVGVARVIFPNSTPTPTATATATAGSMSIPLVAPFSVAPPIQDPSAPPLADSADLAALGVATAPSNSPSNATAHLDDIWSVDWSPIGLIATGGADQIVHIWDPDGTHRASQHINAEAMVVRWSPDGASLAVAEEEQIGIWRLSDDTYRTFTDSSRMLSLDWSDDGSRLASGSYNRAQIWDVAEGSRIFDAQLEAGNLYGVDMAIDGHHLSAITSKGPVLEWDTTSFESPRIVGKHENENGAGYVEYLSDGTIVSGGNSLVLKFFEPGSIEPTRTIEDTHHIGSGKLFSDETRVLVIGQVGTARIIDIDAGVVSQRFAEFERPLTDFSLSPDDRYAVLTSFDGVAQVWDVTNTPPTPMTELFGPSS